jgi:hypothetical protein
LRGCWMGFAPGRKKLTPGRVGGSGVRGHDRESDVHKIEDVRNRSKFSDCANRGNHLKVYARARIGGQNNMV